ncbi:hypothetical protein PAMP_015254 [Pampus punctatissimus]
MANGHVEIHDPLANNNIATDCELSSNTDNMEDTAEYRVMMAFAQRRRPTQDVESSEPGSMNAVNGGSESNGSSPQTVANDEKRAPEEEEKKKKKRKGSKLLRIFGCIKPQTKDEEPQKASEEPQKASEQPADEDNKCFNFKDGDVFDQVAIKLTRIADEVPFMPPDLETDAPDDEVEKAIALLLRESGDKLNERELKNVSLAKELFWDYSFFEKLMKTLLRRMGLLTSDPDSPGPQTSPKTQIAVACEVTSRLSAIDTLPMNRLLGHGARYLQSHHSSWVTQHGGYEAAFHSDDEEEEEEEEEEEVQ